MTEPVVYLSGQFVPASQASINIFDFGIVLGATLTDLTRTFAHKPFKIDQHVARLYRSCRYANIELPLTNSQMIDRCMALIEQNTKLIEPGQDLAIVKFVTPGENLVYAGAAAAPENMTPTVCIHSFPLPFQVWRHLFTDGAHVVTPAIRHVPPQCVDSKTKNRSRLHWWLADQQTHAVDPKGITLLLDLEGNLTETAGSNFVLIKDDVIYSPMPRNILWGVSLDTVRELAPKVGMDFVTKDLQLYDLLNADEAWIPTTPYCLAPVTKANGQPIGDGKPGPRFAKMMVAFSELVDFDVLGQIMG